MAMASEMSTSVVKNWTGWVTEKCKVNRVGLKALLLGQIISLLLTCTGWSSASLVHNGITAPMAQSFAMYALYAIIFGSILIYRRKPIQISWYWYLLIAVVDLEANYVSLKAFQYTSITSIMLLSCWTIPSVLFLTWQFLKTRYDTGHFAGVAICVAGLVVVLFSDIHSQDRASGGSNVSLGDTMVIIVSVFAAILNVSEEFIVKKTDLVEYLAHLGFFCMILSGCQLMFLESQELKSIKWNPAAIAPFIAFALSCIAYSVLVPWVLQMNGAIMLSLSMLTSDVWAVAIRALLFHEKVDGLYFVAFGLVAVGLLVYASARNPSHADEEFLSGPDSEKYTLIVDHLDRESAEP